MGCASSAVEPTKVLGPPVPTDKVVSNVAKEVSLGPPKLTDSMEPSFKTGDRALVIYYKDAKRYPATVGKRTAGGWIVHWDSGETSYNVRDLYIKRVDEPMQKPIVNTVDSTILVAIDAEATRKHVKE